MDTLRTQLDTKLAALKIERDSSWLPHWRELNQYVFPHQGRFLSTDRNNGKKRNEKIANEAATFSVQTSQRGMMYNITNPARPWLKLKTPWPELNAETEVKLWLETVADRILETFQKSNVYTELPKIYGDLLVYGTAAACVNRDAKTTLRLETFPIGSYMLSAGGDGRVDTCVREWQMTRRQVIARFGREAACDSTRNACETGSGLEEAVDIVHVLDPNPDYNPNSPLAMHKKYRSVYYEKSAEDGRFLQVSGFDTFRILTPRWDVQEADAYGTSPCMNILGTIKGLQTLEKQSLQLLSKIINPPLNVPVGLKGQVVTQLPGGLNYYSGLDQGEIKPAFQINSAPLADCQAKIADYETRIRKALFEEVFLMVTNGVQDVTAAEIRARQEEKIQTLGPILLRLNDELLDQLVETAFEIMLDVPGLIPPAPGILQENGGAPLAIEYISEMAKSMKLAGVSGIERTVAFIGNFAGLKPAILDNLDEDEIASIYGDLSGAPVSIMRDKREVKKMRDVRQAQEQQVMQIQKAAAAAKVAKDMGSTDVSGDNLLGVAGGPDAA